MNPLETSMGIIPKDLFALENHDGDKLFVDVASEEFRDEKGAPTGAHSLNIVRSSWMSRKIPSIGFISTTYSDLM
jgi:hypothetical protein